MKWFVSTAKLLILVTAVLKQYTHYCELSQQTRPNLVVLCLTRLREFQSSFTNVTVFWSSSTFVLCVQQIFSECRARPFNRIIKTVSVVHDVLLHSSWPQWLAEDGFKHKREKNQIKSDFNRRESFSCRLFQPPLRLRYQRCFFFINLRLGPCERGKLEK